MNRSLIASCVALGLLGAAAMLAQGQNPKPSTYGNWLPGSQKDKKGEDPNIRSVTGTVRLPNDGLTEGAVVQLKNTKTLQVTSFITKADGIYTFQNLATNVDYELSAKSKGLASPEKTLSTFDTRKRAVIHLRLEEKK